MKSNRKILALFLILTTILSSITVFYISAAQATDETYIDTLETENVVIEQELVPVMARGCSNYDYDSYTMNQLKIEKGWKLRMDGDLDHYIIYSGGTAVGKYHTGRNNGQDPHFHLFATPGVHYILGGI